MLCLGRAFADSGSSAGMIQLANSIRPIPEETPNAAPNPHRPRLVRKTLRAEELASPLAFQVGLKMRNFTELKMRVALGEQISRQEMLEKYDPLPADYAAVVQWLSGQGLTITAEDPARIGVFAKGTIDQIQKALKTSFGRVAFENEEHTSALTPPSVPSNLAPLLIGINGLQPHSHVRKHLMQRATLTSSSAPYVPSQIAQAYSATGLYNNGLTGSGQTIAIVIDKFPKASDLTGFFTNYNVPQTTNRLQMVTVPNNEGASTSPPEGEETLDTEWSGSIAPGATIRVYGTGDLYDDSLYQAYQQVYNDASSHSIHEMSMSYGGNEAYFSSDEINMEDTYFTEIAAAGVTIFASSGDGGSTPGDSGTNPDTTGPLGCENPASDPNVTGVGGTTLYLNSNNTESSETGWTDSGGGVSTFFSQPSWQVGISVSSSGRNVPDISTVADPNTGTLLYLNGSFTQDIYGGTSWSSPTCAAFCALINQARAQQGLPALGAWNSSLYKVLGTAAFRDITSGYNGTGSNSGGLYSAGTGYDCVTGIGAPLVSNLAGQPQPAYQSIAAGQSASFTITPFSNSVTYQWQQEAPGATTWTNLSNNSTYSGVTTATLTISNATSALNGYEYQCVVSPDINTINTSFPSLLVVTSFPTVATLAGQIGTTGNSNGTGTGAQFNYPSALACDSSGNVYVADTQNSSIRLITSTGVVSTLYSSPLKTPQGIALDSSGNLYVADTGNNVIRKISTSGTFSTLGGSATFSAPHGVAVDSSGNVYVADTGDDTIRKIAPGATATVLAGKTGTAGYKDTSGTPAALFRAPTGVAVDSSGNVYVADSGNDVIRKITSGGAVSTYAGQGGFGGYTDGPEAKALFFQPMGVALDSSNNLYVADSVAPVSGTVAGGNALLRVITPAGLVSTPAGDPTISGSSNGTGTSAQFFNPQSVAINPTTGEIYLADTHNQAIRAAGVAPGIATQPLSQVITVGQLVTFSVAPSGMGAFTYQWEFNGSPISGATSSSYTIPNVSSSNAGNYSVLVSNLFGGTMSSPATLIPVGTQPMSQTVTAGQTVMFMVTIQGPMPYSYQWEFNGSPISNATGSTYTISGVSATNAGSYSVIVSDGNGIATTTPFTLTVNPQVVSTDTPTLPLWGLVALAGLLLLAGGRLRPIKR